MVDIDKILNLLNDGGFSIIAEAESFNPNAPVDKRTGRIRELFYVLNGGGCRGVSNDEVKDWLERSLRLGKPARTIVQQEIINSDLAFHYKRDQEAYESYKTVLKNTTLWDV